MWRTLFGLLLLLNLVAFLWGYARQTPLEPRLPPLPDGVPQLRWLPSAPLLEAVPTPQREVNLPLATPPVTH